MRCFVLDVLGAAAAVGFTGDAWLSSRQAFESPSFFHLVVCGQEQGGAIGFLCLCMLARANVRMPRHAFQGGSVDSFLRMPWARQCAAGVHGGPARPMTHELHVSFVRHHEFSVRVEC